MKEHMQASLVVNALRMANFRRKLAPGLVVHSGRGGENRRRMSLRGCRTKWKLRTGQDEKPPWASPLDTSGAYAPHTSSPGRCATPMRSDWMRSMACCWLRIGCALWWRLA